jgi:hypothetical protein
MIVMKPLFTVHVGEYLVGSYIEQYYKRVSTFCCSVPSLSSELRCSSLTSSSSFCG